ncbi:hypothetical protein B0H11DRAFT_2020015 [Mycena galericulata]|nr:hypothetical protein B0H11DRAFT_2020015 [Mycena galericulata]
MIISTSRSSPLRNDSDRIRIQLGVTVGVLTLIYKNRTAPIKERNGLCTLSTHKYACSTPSAHTPEARHSSLRYSGTIFEVSKEGRFERREDGGGFDARRINETGGESEWDKLANTRTTKTTTRYTYCRAEFNDEWPWNELNERGKGKDKKRRAKRREERKKGMGNALIAQRTFPPRGELGGAGV